MQLLSLGIQFIHGIQVPCFSRTALLRFSRASPTIHSAALFHPAGQDNHYLPDVPIPPSPLCLQASQQSETSNVFSRIMDELCSTNRFEPLLEYFK